MPGYNVLVSDSSVSAYYSISSDSTGSLTSIVANDNFTGRRIVELIDGDYFKLQRAKLYTKSNAPAVEKTDGYYTEGMYEVGVDIEAGEYKLEVTGSNGYVEVASSPRHLLTNIITNDNFNSSKYQTVTNGQFITITGAKMCMVTNGDNNNPVETNYMIAGNYRVGTDIQGDNNNPVETNYMIAGNYRVGTDIQAGTYVLVPDSSLGGYFSISSDSSSSLDSIIANGSFNGRYIVKIDAGQYLNVERAKIYAKNQAPEIVLSNGYYPEGMYEVGVDIKAGEYIITATGSLGGYVAVYSEPTHVMADLIVNDNFKDTKYQTVSNGQFIIVTRAQMKPVA
jgi:hypothetical protein